MRRIGLGGMLSMAFCWRRVYVMASSQATGSPHWQACWSCGRSSRPGCPPRSGCGNVTSPSSYLSLFCISAARKNRGSKVFFFFLSWKQWSPLTSQTHTEHRNRFQPILILFFATQLLRIHIQSQPELSTHITCVFLSLFSQVVPGRYHGREASFSSLLLVLFGVGDLQKVHRMIKYAGDDSRDTPFWILQFRWAQVALERWFYFDIQLRVHVRICSLTNILLTSVMTKRKRRRRTWLKLSAFSLAWSISAKVASALALPFISCS